jgi:hypothetical protein
MHFQVDVTPTELARGLAASGSSSEQEYEPGYEGESESDYESGEVVEESFLPFDLIRSFFRPPTLGFEFDVHYGVLPDLLPAGAAMPLKNAPVSTHTWATDGFLVKLDGRRLEINTKPFEVNATGREDLRQASARIRSFADELSVGCRNATPSPPIPGVSGSPRPFSHPRIAGLPIVKLPVGGRFTNCSVWAAPQATLTIRLSKVADLVRRIKANEGKGPGVALTGDSSTRMGLQSEALYRALREVTKARRATPFSDDLEGFLILLASYLWTSELPYRFPDPDQPARSGQDYEIFGKAYLPINVKTPFSQIFKTLLSGADQAVFRDRFANGAARVNLFRLALPAGTTVADGARKFLPPGREVGGNATVHAQQHTRFGRVPTWDDLVEHTLDSTHNSWAMCSWFRYPNAST